MKKAIFFAALLLITYTSFSQYNYKFNYQAVVRNGSGVLVPNGNTVSFKLSILESSASGTVLYSETQTKQVNNNQGLVNLVIGDGVPAGGGIVYDANFRDLTKEKFLKVEVDPTGGTSYTDMGATKLQFVPYAAHAFSATYAENGTQWNNGTNSSLNYTVGNVNIGNSAPTGSSRLNVEASTTTDNVITATQTGTAGGGLRAAVYGKNNSTNSAGIGVMGTQAGNGWGVYGEVISGTGVYGYATGTGGVGVNGAGTTGVHARTTATNGTALLLDGYLKVGMGSTKTAYKTSPLTVAASNITLTYGAAASTDIVMVTPATTSTSAILPSWVLIWTSPNWIIYNASDDGSPSNFPAGTSFNILVIKQ